MAYTMILKKMITYDKVSNSRRVVANCGELGPDELVTIVECFADRSKNSFVEDHHEKEELGSNDGEGKVEVKYFSGLARK